jgi:hypothetical protein
MVASMKAISSLFILHLLILAVASIYMGGTTPMLVAVCSTRTMDTQLDLELGGRIPAHERRSQSVYGPRDRDGIASRKIFLGGPSGVLLPLLPIVIVFTSFGFGSYGCLLLRVAGLAGTIPYALNDVYCCFPVSRRLNCDC